MDKEISGNTKTPDRLASHTRSGRLISRHPVARPLEQKMRPANDNACFDRTFLMLFAAAYQCNYVFVYVDRPTKPLLPMYRLCK